MAHNDHYLNPLSDTNIETFLNKYKVIALSLLLHVKHYMQGILWKSSLPNMGCG